MVGSNSLPISKLINELGNSDWINTGRAYLQKDETFSDEFKQQIELFLVENTKKM